MHKLLARLKIPFKVLVAPIITTVMMVSLWGLATSGLRQQEQTLQFLVEHTMPSVRAANQLTQETARVQSSLFRILVWHSINREQTVIDRLSQDVKQNIPKLEGHYADLVEKARAFNDPTLSELGNQLNKYLRIAEATRQTAYETPGFANTMLINTTALYDSLITGLNEFERHIADRARQRASEAAGGASDLIRLLGLVVLIDMVIAVSITLLVSHHISSGIKRTTQRMRALVDGDVSFSPAEPGRNDEIGEMLGALEVFRQTEIERRQLEAQRIEAEKLASLGSLVAGVAHEINTPIGICLTAASHLGEETNKVQRGVAENQITKRQLKDYLQRTNDATQIIQNNIQQASNLIQSFKQVSADQASGEFREVALRSYLDEVIQSVWPKLRRANIQIENHCDDDTVLTTYPGSLSQVVTNLIMNAMNHAFGEAGGTLVIHGGVLPPDVEPDHAQGLYLSVCDNGAGIDAETRRQIFEPFFTTLGGAGGTGLGLHLVHNIVTQTLSGRIECHSEVGRGTCFDIVLPVDPRNGPPPVFGQLPRLRLGEPAEAREG